MRWAELVTRTVETTGAYRILVGGGSQGKRPLRRSGLDRMILKWGFELKYDKKYIIHSYTTL
jgi:hypothetical protein